MFVEDKIKQGYGVGNLIKNLNGSSAKEGKQMTAHEMKNPGIVLEIIAKNGGPAVSIGRNIALFLFPAVKKFYHTGK